MSYFHKVKTITELKQEYRRLAAKYHPDRGGDARQMQEINAFYQHFLVKLKKQQCRKEAGFRTDGPDRGVDFAQVKIGETVFVNGTEGEVIAVGDDWFRVVAKGRNRQAVFEKAGGKGRYNKRLNASYDNRHRKPVASTV